MFCRFVEQVIKTPKYHRIRMILLPLSMKVMKSKGWKCFSFHFCFVLWWFFLRQIPSFPEIPYSIVLIAIVAVTCSVPVSTCQHNPSELKSPIRGKKTEQSPTLPPYRHKAKQGRCIHISMQQHQPERDCSQHTYSF